MNVLPDINRFNGNFNDTSKFNTPRYIREGFDQSVTNDTFKRGINMTDFNREGRKKLMDVSHSYVPRYIEYENDDFINLTNGINTGDVIFNIIETRDGSDGLEQNEIIPINIANLKYFFLMCAQKYQDRLHDLRDKGRDFTNVEDLKKYLELFEAKYEYGLDLIVDEDGEIKIEDEDKELYNYKKKILDEGTEYKYSIMELRRNYIKLIGIIYPVNDKVSNEEQAYDAYNKTNPIRPYIASTNKDNVPKQAISAIALQIVMKNPFSNENNFIEFKEKNNLFFMFHYDFYIMRNKKDSSTVNFYLYISMKIVQTPDVDPSFFKSDDIISEGEENDNNGYISQVENKKIYDDLISDLNKSFDNSVKYYMESKNRGIKIDLIPNITKEAKEEMIKTQIEDDKNDMKKLEDVRDHLFEYILRRVEFEPFGNVMHGLETNYKGCKTDVFSHFNKLNGVGYHKSYLNECNSEIRTSYADLRINFFAI